MRVLGISALQRLNYSLLAIAAAACLSALALKFLPVPFFWVGTTFAIAGIAVATFAPRAAWFPIVTVCGLAVSLALGELYFAITSPPEVDRVVNPSLNRYDAVLGWKPKAMQIVRASASVGNETIYDVTYTIDVDGRRIAPPDRGNDVEGCILFFADSFIFGEGVGDEVTLPYMVGKRTGGRFRIVNFAAPGYGAEQMLSTIERGELAGVPPCRPTHVFYAALPHHVHRAAGKTSFSNAGPRYRLDPSGKLEYLGTPPESDASPHTGIWESAKRLLAGQRSKSRIYRAWLSRPPPTTEADVELYSAIVREAMHQMRRRWPEVELHVISWDIHDFYANGQDRFHRGLQTTEAKIHFINEILPGYTSDPERYSLGRLELHPNRAAYGRVATYLAENVLPPAKARSP